MTFFCFKFVTYMNESPAERPLSHQRRRPIDTTAAMCKSCLLRDDRPEFRSCVYLYESKVGMNCSDICRNVTAENEISRFLFQDLFVRYNNTYIMSCCTDIYFPFYECICEHT